MMPEHYSMAPCQDQPGRQGWHLRCALAHPVRFIRSRSVVHPRGPRP
jgi:hypothetical protein